MGATYYRNLYAAITHVHALVGQCVTCRERVRVFRMRVEARDVLVGVLKVRVGLMSVRYACKARIERIWAYIVHV